MSLFQGEAPDPVELESTVTTKAPEYLTNYLGDLATAGTAALGTTSPEGTFTPFTGDQLIADLPENLQTLYGDDYATDMLGRYQDPMADALTALQSGAAPITADDISAFYNPYEQSVVDEMGRQSALNFQRAMPSLKGAFAGSGGFGGQRYANAMGQSYADVQSNLLGQQAKLRQEGYTSALDAALKSRGYDIQAGQGLTSLGQAESAAATNALKSLMDVGTQQLAYDQSIIEAPLTRAQNVAEIMRGYTYPTTVEKTEEQLPTVVGPSPLSQIAGLGTLVGAAFGNEDAAGYKLVDALGDVATGVKDFITGEPTYQDQDPIFQNTEIMPYDNP